MTTEDSGLLEAYHRVGIGTPHNFQELTWKNIVAGKNILISAGTGSGKTEAAFLPALTSGKRIIVLYPTKALLQDQVERIKKLASVKTIAVDTGDEDDRSFYRADIILTSLDKFLYRLFGYGKKRWSYLYPYRIGFVGERRTILILDEAHAYEEVAFSHFWFLLKKLTYERRVQTVLLSATLPPPLVEALEDPGRQYFPRTIDEGKFFEKVEDHEGRSGTVVYNETLHINEIVDKSLESFDRFHRVIIVLGRVVPAREAEQAEGHSLHEVWKVLAEKITGRAPTKTPKATLANLNGNRVDGNVLAYHGHQMPSYRSLVLERLKSLDDGWKPDKDGNPRRGEPFVLVTTSAMEIGVDISCDVMITDLCEPDSFVQRIGRCARRRGEMGQVYIITGDKDGTARRGKLLWHFLKDWSVGTQLDMQSKKELNSHNTLPDLTRVHLRLEYLQDQSLYRYVYDFVEENRELWEKGVVVTRDWEPSVVLVVSEKRKDGDYIGGIPSRDFWRGNEIREKMLLPLSGAASLAPYCAWVFDSYNEGNQYVQRVAVGGSRERTLEEALRFAGLNPRKQSQNSNRVEPLYALSFPLILLLAYPRPEHGNWPYQDSNLGLSYHAQYIPSDQEPKVFAPSPLLRAKKVLLKKGKKEGRRESWEYELPLYWFEPYQEAGAERQ